MLLALGVGAAAGAQPENVDQIEANLTAQSQRVEQVSRQLASPSLDEASLSDALETLLDIGNILENDSEALNQALDEPNQRLRQLGPPSGKGAPPESPDIAKLRDELTKQVSRLEGLSKTAELTDSTVGDLIDQIRDKKRALFLSDLGTRNSPFSPGLWTEAIAQSGAVLGQTAKRWRERRQSEDWAGDIALLLVALVLAIALLLLPRWRPWRQFEARVDENPAPSTLDKRERVAGRSGSRALLATAAGGLVYGAALETQFLSPVGERVGLRIWLGIAVLVFIWSRAQAFYSPDKPLWRLAPCRSQAAPRLRNLLVGTFVVLVLDRTLTAIFRLPGAGLELELARAILSTSLFAALLWSFMSPRLWQADDDPEATTPAAATADADEERAKVASSRLRDLMQGGGRVLAILLLVAVALGYVRLANFTFQRVGLSILFVLLLWSVRLVASWALAKLPASIADSTQVTADGELDAQGEPLSFWLKLALDLTLVLLSIPGFMLIVGFDWLDVRRAFDFITSDIQVGAVSFSILNILTGVFVFLLISAGTRWTTSVVDKQVLQQTHMGTGSRASMTTLVNYTGLLIGILVALPIAGVSFSRIAIIAGALSVGIGFGLQNIVNNFVSGLILLFERPIKVGDWIVVQSGEGYVTHIGVRATEILTFDRATIIVPNSEFVSSSVQNWFYRNRVGRIRVPVGVAYGSDPEQVRSILLDCAKQNAHVMPHPSPEVVWTEFGESSIDFELRAYLKNCDHALRQRSDLRFAIFKALEEAGVVIPFPQRDVHMVAESSGD
ncbi:MAG: mechanosensitive ion channel domain-containing protein [Polyangiales bacterium]